MEKDENGYYNISDYYLNEIVFLDSKMAFWMIKKDEENTGLIIKMENIISFIDKSTNKERVLLRIDNDGSSFGLDISSRLDDEKFLEHKMMYVFEDINHTSVVLRVLAKEISIESYMGTKNSWPF